jgi:predicted RecB family nuclease
VISDEVFVNHLDCRRKAYFNHSGVRGEASEIEAVFRRLDETYARDARTWFIAQHQRTEVRGDGSTLESVLKTGAHFVVGGTAVAGNLGAKLDLLERVDGDKGEAPRYAPVLFARHNKVTRRERLLLSFQAVALSLVQGQTPEAGKIVYGSERRVARVRLAPLIEKAREVIARIEADAAAGAAPVLTLNRHCAACGFRDGCLASAEQTDDLSLLRVLPEGEVERLRSRGVTTLTQFSHTYRPGRRGKRRPEKARRHDPALQALALREKKVYAVDAQPLARPEVALYLDLEGVPDRRFDYLLGLLVVEKEGATFHNFWADDPVQEKVVWEACLRVIDSFPDSTLYHYGQYERRFLERMKGRGGEESAAAIDRVLSRSCNVLSLIHSHLYFPTRSNGLKDVAGFLGFRWSVEGVSGLQALAWRLSWESDGQGAFKEKLLQYNREDCLALQRVTEFVLSVSSGSPHGQAADCPAVEDASSRRRPGAFCFSKQTFFCPDLEHINRCAYSDYQREKVYVRTSAAVRKSVRRRSLAARKKLKVNEDVECPRPDKCPECGWAKIYHFRSRWDRKVILDLKYTASGVKRWVVRYSSMRYQCGKCRATFTSPDCAWMIYQNVALRQSQEDVSQGLNDLFGFSFNRSRLSSVKARMARAYRPAYERLKEELRGGPLVHADETRANVKGEVGYVWAFTNLEETVYVYTPTRDGKILEEVLRGFKGVLVSDFYAAYDGVDCAQQKCLIHLMRDVNDDLFHNPFDEELKRLAHKLVGVLRPVIDTIDAHGLKRHFLHRHRKDADAFFGYLESEPFRSELASHYRKRMLKYRDKLFTFLDHDGVPWNNNNSEVAVKRFASRRRMTGASFTEKGLRDYLVFLSIYQTCRNKNLSFLRFLRSGSLDLGAFAEGLSEKRR